MLLEEKDKGPTADFASVILFPRMNVPIPLVELRSTLWTCFPAHHTPHPRFSSHDFYDGASVAWIIRKHYLDSTTPSIAHSSGKARPRHPTPIYKRLESSHSVRSMVNSILAPPPA